MWKAGANMTHSVDYLIIGNSAAGVTAAENLRMASPSSSILMISEEPYPAYGRPLISYLVEGKTTEDAIWLKDDAFYERLGIQTSFGRDSKATELDAHDHRVKLRSGETIEYGKCLLATGSVPFVPPIEGLAEAEGVYPFMTLDDAKAAWAAVEAATKKAHESGRTSRVVVIGAGLIGLKAAEALSYHADEVVVLELAPRILPAVLDSEGAVLLQDALASHGIICLPGISAKQVQSVGGMHHLILTDDCETDCDVIITAVGVRPNSELAVEAGAQQGRGLIVDESLRTTLPDVYAAGDVVQVLDVLDGSSHPLALWPNAMRQGRFAGLNMAGSEDAPAFLGSFAVNAVDFFDVSLLTAGVINPPEDGPYEQTVISDEATYAKFVVKDGLLCGYILLNRPSNAGIYTAIIENRIPLDSLSSNIFEDMPLNLDFPLDQRWERLHKCYPEGLDMQGWKGAS